MISDEIIKLSKEIFPELRKGTHLSSDNCKLYQNAIDNQEQLIRIYKSVGFDLVIKDGYFYIDGSDDSLVNKKLALTLVLKTCLTVCIVVSKE